MLTFFQYLVTAYGGKVGYFRGDVKLLLEDAQALHPTFFPMVPRLMNRLYAGVKGIQIGVPKSLILFGVMGIFYIFVRAE